MMKIRILKIAAGMAFILLMMASTSIWDQQWDLSVDGRNTISPITKSWISKIDQPVAVTMLLTGDNVPSSFRLYADYIDFFLSEIDRSNPNIEIFYQDPSDGLPEEQAAFKEALARQGVTPIRRQVASEDEASSALLYPFMSIGTLEKISFMDLLEPQVSSDESKNLIVSQQAFEAKFVRLLKETLATDKPAVHVLGTAAGLVAEGLNQDLGISTFQFVGSSAERLLAEADSVAAVLAIVRDDQLTRTDVMAIDVVAGKDVPVIWCVDRFDMSIDSLSIQGKDVAVAHSHLVEDYLFRYGIRIEPELIMDLRSRKIPQVVNAGSDRSTTQMMNYPFHLATITTDETPLIAQVKEPLAFSFVSPITILPEPASIKKEMILSTSPYTRTKKAPVELSFEMLYQEATAENMQDGEIPIAVRVQGQVRPFLRQRLLSDEKQLLRKYDLSYTDKQEVDQVIIADADFILPSRGRNGRYYPIGYDRYEQHKFAANTRLLQRLLESQVFGNDLLQLGAKEYRVSLLDKEKYGKNQSTYAIYLIIAPLLLLLLGYLGYHFIRRKMYAY